MQCAALQTVEKSMQLQQWNTALIGVCHLECDVPQCVQGLLSGVVFSKHLLHVAGSAANLFIHITVCLHIYTTCKRYMSVQYQLVRQGPVMNQNCLHL